MANIKSQIKRNRQNERRRVRNKATRSELKTLAKGVRGAVDSGDTQAAITQLRDASRALDRAASAGSIHARTAARRKSRLAKAVNAATA